MKAVTVDELNSIDESSITLLDIRPESDYKRAPFKNAVHINTEDIEKKLSEIPKNKPVYVLCQRGNKSIITAGFLEEKGYDANYVEGGYCSYLHSRLGDILADEEAVITKRNEIERSIIKKFKKPVWRKFTKAINVYNLINDGDKIAVCISGGKDSMLLAKLFQELLKHGKKNFDLEFLIMNPGYNEENWQIILNNAKILGISLTVFKTDIFNIVEGIDKNPCYLCARMRRGFLYSHAKELGCNKIALGHHFDDVIETTLMGMLYSGKFEAMLPKLHSKNFEGMELIRPMYMIKEESIKAWKDYNQLDFIQCACRFTENCENCNNETTSKRQEMKELIASLKQKDPRIEANLFNSIHNVNLSTIIGWKDESGKHSFLDNYDEDK